MYEQTEHWCFAFVQCTALQDSVQCAVQTAPYENSLVLLSL